MTMRHESAWPVRLTALACLALMSTAAHAQLAELQPGVRFRFRAPEVAAGRVMATVLERHGDSLVVGGLRNGVTHLTLATLETVDVSRGRSRALGAVRGVLWGGGLGLLSGLIAGATPGQCGYQATCESLSRGEMAAESGAGGAMLGALCGALIGAERWQKLRLPAQASLNVTPGSARVGVAVHF